MPPIKNKNRRNFVEFFLWGGGGAESLTHCFSDIREE